MKQHISNFYFWVFILMFILSVVSDILRSKTIDIQDENIRLSNEIIRKQSEIIDSLRIRRTEFDNAVKMLESKKK